MTTITINGVEYHISDEKQTRKPWSEERRAKIAQYQDHIHKLMEELSITYIQAQQLYKQLPK